MQDANTALQAAMYASLNGNLTLGAANVPVYDRVPVTATYPYVHFGDVATVEDSDKTGFGQIIVKDVHIVTGFTGNAGTVDHANSIATQITQLINSKNKLTLASPFALYITALQGGALFTETTKTHYIVHRVLTFTFTIQQLV